MIREGSIARAPRSVLDAQISAPRTTGIVLMSIGTHMLMLGALGFMPSPDQFFKLHPVEMEVMEPPPPPPPPPPPVEPEKPKAPEPVRAAPKPAAPKPAPTPEPPKVQAEPPPEAPVDFGGITEAADSSSWTTRVGNGQALTAPVGRIAPVTGRDKAGTGVAPAPVVVPESSLSRLAVPPPDMSDLLLQNYPPSARAQGIAGSARLRMRIYPDGHVGDIQLIRETGNYGFGAACTKILRMRRWQPPLDKQGRPVLADARYECDFEVAY